MIGRVCASVHMLNTHPEKLAQIKGRVKPHTLRKAAITGEQLQRRYSILLDPARPSVNILSAARWYNQQDLVVRTALDSAQPLTWLKHLLDKRTVPGATRLPWHVTAIILEEYAKAVHPSLQPIPEDSEISRIISPVTPPPGETLSSTGKASSRVSVSSFPRPLIPSQPLEPSLSRRRADFSEDGISFEPQVDSGRSSAGGDSRRSSYDFIYGRRQPLSYGPTESPSSSLRNSSVGNYGMSASSSRMHFRDLANRVRRRPNEKNEELLSSARNSMSDLSVGEEASLGKRKAKARPTSLQSPVILESPSDVDGLEAGDKAVHSEPDGILTARVDHGPMHFSEATVTARDSAQTPSLPHTPPMPSTKPRVTNALRRRRKSLTMLDQLLIHEQEKQQLQMTEEQERLEYEHRLQ
jgi:hypothetical protein